MVEGAGDIPGRTATTFINGLAPIGQGDFFATRSGLDLAVGAALLRATRGNARVVADIEDFILGDWPESGPGQVAYWKNVNCEPPGGFSAGPHSNPYHLTALSGSEVLIADAAGNFLLHAKTNGKIEVVATFDPVTDPGGDPLVQFSLPDGTDCPVEPVPTAVEVGPDGAYYVGQLTGTTAENLVGEASPDGLASVWRIEPGARDVVCPSPDCTKAVTGLNSVIDIEFGPDGQLYVVEFDSNGFFSALFLEPGLGTVKRCDVVNDSCAIVEDELVLPGAITFDKWDNLWLVENVFAPTVRQVEVNG